MSIDELVYFCFNRLKKSVVCVCIMLIHLTKYISYASVIIVVSLQFSEFV